MLCVDVRDQAAASQLVGEYDAGIVQAAQLEVEARLEVVCIQEGRQSPFLQDALQANNKSAVCPLPGDRSKRNTGERDAGAGRGCV